MTEQFDIKAILETIPHRYPFILIDRVLAFKPRKFIKAIKNVSINEPFFQGHFPGNPIMPGVLILESMAQALAVLALKTLEVEGTLTGREIFFYAGVDKARFKRPIMPGDQMVIEFELTKQKGPILKGHSIVTVDGEIACEADILASNTSKEKIAD